MKVTATRSCQELICRADGGSIRIFAGPLACQFNAGSGDGRYKVVIDEHRVYEQKGELWKFVDSFEVSGPGVRLSSDDCDDRPIFQLSVGRWFVHHQRDEFLVLLQKCK
jgi:hypothetical protein